MSEIDQLRRRVLDLRSCVEKAFGPETAAEGFHGSRPSAGQCAATALIAHDILGGEFVSTHVQGQAHWFNRVWSSDRWWDVDLTGDQFGYPPVQIAEADRLYSESKRRDAGEVDSDTLHRAVRLAESAGMSDVTERLQTWLDAVVRAAGG